MDLSENVSADYKALQFSLKAHPMKILRKNFINEKTVTCSELKNIEPGSIVRLAGIVLIRQRPSSAKGIIFITLEDETGTANLIIWPHKMERYRRTVIGSTLLGVEGKIQRQDNIIHVIAEKLYDVSFQLACLTKTKIERREDDPLMKKNARAQKKIRSRNFY